MEMICDGRGRFGVRVLGYILYRHRVVGGGVYGIGFIRDKYYNVNKNIFMDYIYL